MYREALICQRNAYKWIKHGFTTTNLKDTEKDTYSPMKEKVPAQKSVKNSLLTVFWGMKRPITNHFL